MHHADVGRADVGLHVARGHGRDHHLGHADRQARASPGVASAVPPEPPAEMMPPRSRRVMTKRSKAMAISRHRRAAIAGEHRPLAAGMMPRHLARRHRCRRRRARGREIDRDGAQAQLLQAIAQEAQLAALGVEGAGDVGGAAEGGRHRQLDDAGVAPGPRQGGRRGLERRRRGHRLGPAADDLVARPDRGVRRVPAREAAHGALLRRRRRGGRIRHRAVIVGATHREDACFSFRRRCLLGRGSSRPRHRRRSSRRAAAAAGRDRPPVPPPAWCARCGR